jgi:SAM-dependent methyltransferase
VYPALNWLRGQKPYYLRVAPYLADAYFDEVCFSNRGNDPAMHLTRTRELVELETSDVLVLGCGSGEELKLWEAQSLRSLTGCDFFPQPVEWARRDAHMAAMDVSRLAFADNSFDLVSSTALLEHVRDLEACMAEMARVTRPGGIVFANFGPLYRSFGGAHFLGSYEHLWMDDAQFAAYLEARNIPYEREEALHWLQQDMFSRATYDEYLALFRDYFELAHVTLTVSPEALRFKREQPQAWASLRERFSEQDLCTFAMRAWLRVKPMVVSLEKRRAA